VPLLQSPFKNLPEAEIMLQLTGPTVEVIYSHKEASGFRWKTSSHLVTAYVRTGKPVRLGAFLRTMMGDKDSHLTKELGADCSLISFLYKMHQLKEK
jgi:hypothetical protein